MISSVYQLCYILDITVILTTFQNIQEKVLRNLSSNFFLHIPKSYSDIVQYRVGYYYIFFLFFFSNSCVCAVLYMMMMMIMCMEKLFVLSLLLWVAAEEKVWVVTTYERYLSTNYFNCSRILIIYPLTPRNITNKVGKHSNCQFFCGYDSHAPINRQPSH